MRKYKIKGTQAQELYASIKTGEQIRKAVAPSVLEKYKDVILEAMDERKFRKQGYQEIAKSYLKYMKQVLHENKYLDRLDKTTMMVKFLRKEFEETTQRRTHVANATRIGREIASRLGLRVDLTGLMLEYHDIGHTFYGHDGEWMISEILEKYGLGVLCHNAEGPRRLLFREEIYRKVLNKIKEQEPNIKPWKLKVIKEHLWIVLDGILTHNGESAITIFEVEQGKTEERFKEDLLRCYIEKKADRKIKPATIEACVLRISDIISYAARDFVDGFREGFIDDIDDDYVNVFIQFGIPVEILNELKIEIDQIKQAKENGNKDLEKLLRQQIAKKIEKQIVRPVEDSVIDDVVKNSSKSRIVISQEMADNKLFKLRKLNDDKFITAKATPDLESGVFPIAIEDILKKGKNILIEEGIIKQFSEKKSATITEETKSKYAEQPAIIQLLEFIEKSNKSDYKFTESVAIHRKRGENGETLKKDEAVAMLMTAQFLASLNDVEFVKLINEFGEITETQRKGLETKFISGEVPPARKSKYMEEIHKEQEAESKAQNGNDENDENDGGNSR